MLTGAVRCCPLRRKARSRLMTSEARLALVQAVATVIAEGREGFGVDPVEELR